MKNCVIITAAGMSKRQKQNKLLIRFCHETIIEKTVYTFTNLDIDIFVVVGHQNNEIVPILEHRFGNDISIIVNEKYKTGIASSIKSALSVAGDKYNYYGFCNGDKPFIKMSTVKSVISYINNNKPDILVPIFQDKIGHPTYFSEKYLHSFYELEGDVGGKYVIDKYPNMVTYLPVDDEGIIIDMDKYLSK